MAQVTVQPSGFAVTESAHFKVCLRQKGGFLVAFTYWYGFAASAKSWAELLLAQSIAAPKTGIPLRSFTRIFTHSPEMKEFLQILSTNPHPKEHNPTFVRHGTSHMPPYQNILCP